MITKSLSDLHTDIKFFQEKIQVCEDPEEKIKLKNEFISILKLYLADANQLIKETFKTEITPFKKSNSQNALYQAEAMAFSKKTKDEFLNEINNLTNSAIYTSLEDEKKIIVDNALYVFKNYYQDYLE